MPPRRSPFNLFGPVVISAPRASRKQTSGSPLGTTLPLRIELLDSEPLIWRRVLVPDTITLDHVHSVVQSVFDWDNSHMSAFRTVGHGRRWFDDDETVDTLLVDAISPSTKNIDYIYDMGDSWVHRVKVERRRKADPAVSVPVCVEGANAAPPEDSGGVWGYSSKVKVLSDPKDSDHSYVQGWFGKGWDATAFDLDKANRRLKARFTPSAAKVRG